MPTIGLDCEIILDGNGYFLKPTSYRMRQQRVRHISYRADGGLAYTDLGPGRRTWNMIVLARNEMKCYDGLSTGLTGQQYRDSLRASFLSNVGSTINFIDPLNGSAIPVHFEHYEESIHDLHSQIISLATGGTPAACYEIAIELLEA
jgi:hypothetical protein